MWRMNHTGHIYDTLVKVKIVFGSHLSIWVGGDGTAVGGGGTERSVVYPLETLLGVLGTGR